jgi:hypothetical protein
MKYYNWNDTENKQYLKFLKNKRALFDLTPLERQILKVNVLMSRKIPTRTSTQCYSHHQKMLVKHGSIDNIINNLD